MSKMFKCECGCKDFLWFSHFVKCQKCKSEYYTLFQGVDNSNKFVFITRIRRFNKDGNFYTPWTDYKIEDHQPYF